MICSTFVTSQVLVGMYLTRLIDSITHPSNKDVNRGTPNVEIIPVTKPVKPSMDLPVLHMIVIYKSQVCM